MLSNYNRAQRLLTRVEGKGFSSYRFSV
ncbi:hypothetical protein Golax_001657 [Gossypium laxum]|uniref:Uncharacterized protein n=1 Tax=Gossypium laxum TaxID=34288 RepID=A0A7J9AZJ6_9ROSI|nr:hypothetical protein [Gossypium laxum]